MAQNSRALICIIKIDQIVEFLSIDVYSLIDYYIVAKSRKFTRIWGNTTKDRLDLVIYLKL